MKPPPPPPPPPTSSTPEPKPNPPALRTRATGITSRSPTRTGSPQSRRAPPSWATSLRTLISRWLRASSSGAGFLAISVLVGREVALPRAAHRTEPRVGDVLERGSRWDAAVRVAVGRIVDEPAGLTDPALRCLRLAHDR